MTIQRVCGLAPVRHRPGKYVCKQSLVRFETPGHGSRQLGREKISAALLISRKWKIKVETKLNQPLLGKMYYNNEARLLSPTKYSPTNLHTSLLFLVMKMPLGIASCVWGIGGLFSNNTIMTGKTSNGCPPCDSLQ